MNHLCNFRLFEAKKPKLRVIRDKELNDNIKDIFIELIEKGFEITPASFTGDDSETISLSIVKMHTIWEDEGPRPTSFNTDEVKDQVENYIDYYLKYNWSSEARVFYYRINDYWQTKNSSGFRNGKLQSATFPDNKNTDKMIIYAKKI